MISVLIETARAAGAAILEIYHTDFSTQEKADASPLTAADLAANAIIVKALQQLTPAIPIISEETKQVDFSIRKNWTTCWVVDPLDGTKEFIKRNGEFTVNIALVENGKPILGVVYAPVLEVLYYAEKGKGAHKIEKHVVKEIQHHPFNTLRVLASRSHLSAETAAFIEDLKKENDVEFLSIGSSLKFCLIAEGKADIYPRFAPTMEWDTAAGQIIAEEAGKKVFEYNTKTPLRYNKENLLNPWFIVR